MQLLLVCNPASLHLGRRFARACSDLGIAYVIADVREASSGLALASALCWRVAKRPIRLRPFSQSVLDVSRKFKPDLVLSVGLSPIDAETLRQLEWNGVKTGTFLADDPWSKAHNGRWLLRALPLYSFVFTPRHANEQDLRMLGCRDVRYLRFGYGREIHYVESQPWITEPHWSSDAVFVGGADPDRVHYMEGLIRVGVHLTLYGGYWHRYPATKALAGGVVDGAALRQAVSTARCAVCLVRKSNRDSHCMRTFEMPAMGAFCVIEDTDDHRELFGKEGNAVLYFRTRDELVDKVRWAIDRPEIRRELARKAYRIITEGKHSYTDRLQEILNAVAARATAA